MPSVISVTKPAAVVRVVLLIWRENEGMTVDVKSNNTNDTAVPHDVL